MLVRGGKFGELQILKEKENVTDFGETGCDLLAG